MKRPILFIFFSFVYLFTQAQPAAKLENNILTLSNSFIERQFQWNNGEVISSALIDKQDGKNLIIPDKLPDVIINQAGKPVEALFTNHWIEETSILQKHLEAEITVKYAQFTLKRVFRIYENSPAIACDNYLLIDPSANEESLKLLSEKPIRSENLKLTSNHLRLTATEFFDRTDSNNNLVKTDQAYSFSNPVQLKGNILRAESSCDTNGIFILKEAPCSFVQLDYPAYDFINVGATVSAVGIGITMNKLLKGEWIKTYGTVVGVYNNTELGFMEALRSYQKSLRTVIASRDEMVMMNTWGDRNQDASINEKFLKGEIDACARLGITHFQIDDGWQQGLSMNSANKSGQKWDVWEAKDWQPHAERLPNGFKPIVEYAAKKGIQLGLWFHPSNYNSYENWQTDAEIMLNLYKKYKIRYFKIDGTQIHDKLADSRLRMLFEKVTRESNGEIFINLDATADNRTGYHYLNTFGNIFLENRYTDWGKYYPHWTLRNLWQLSAYVPAEKLQVEFLNKWRNAAKYPENDPLAPSKIPFDYQFAITMMAQPLAWFEGTGLPEEAFQIAPMIKKYTSLQNEIHSGMIFPIGQEPSGFNWTGFQSIINDHSGFLLIFREKNKQDQQLISTYLPAGKQVILTPELGKGQAQTRWTNEDGKLRFFLPKEFSFALYRYEIK